jgi:hypothetical protein
MSDYMPGAVQVPQPGGVTLDRSLPPRFVWHITWDQLRADGSQPDFSAVANYLQGKEYCPHIMWNPFTGYMEQYYPASVGSRALAYNDQDGAACIQVEVFFTPGCVVDGVKYNTVADTPLRGWAELLAWGDSLGVPRTWPMGAPQWQGNARDASVWNGNGGHYGHCHSPGDTHTDPGPMPSLNGGTISVEGTITQTTTTEDDEMISQEAQDWLRANLLTKNDGGQLRADTTYQNGLITGLFTKADGAWQNGVLANLPAKILNQPFALPDGTTTNLAGILGQIHAKPAAVPGAPAAVDVDALVARLKAELPAAVLAELTAKLTKP